MEGNTPHLTLGDPDRAHLATAGRWAKFLAIVYFICIAIGCLFFLAALLGMLAAGAAVGSEALAMLPKGVLVTYFLAMVAVLVLNVIPVRYLYNFGRRAIAAATENDAEALSHSLAGLARYFRFLGIILIVSFAVSVMLLGAGIFVAASVS